jgi:PadR family transcriptional regulator PadR
LDLVQGTLDVLILKGLSWGPKHGYAVARWIEDLSRDSLKVLDGALYTSLHRMETRGWIAAEWGISDKGRKARFYRLTPLGRKQLRSEADSWTAYAATVGRILRSTTEPA